MIVINVKNYFSGNDVLRFAKKLHTNLSQVIVCPPHLQLERIKQETKLTVFSQHVDAAFVSASTGKVTIDSLKKSKVQGTLLNHSEHRIPYGEIKQVLVHAKRQGIKVILCAENLSEVKQFKKLSPWAIAYEEPTLIGSGKSITEYKAEDVRTFAHLLKNTTILSLCGAGISSPEDYITARKLGCRGILVASSLAKSSQPDTFLKKAFQK